MDPCIPKGYNQSTIPDITLNESEKQLPAAYSMGNFSACRSVALSLLQEGQGGMLFSSLLPFIVFECSLYCLFDDIFSAVCIPSFIFLCEIIPLTSYSLDRLYALLHYVPVCTCMDC